MKQGLILFFAFAAFGMARGEPMVEKRLFFPVEKSRIQILPQRFEYQLRNKDQLQIGNILLDANQIEMQILPTDKGRRYRLRFRWPAGLLSEGEIAIKDNSGKGIWFQKIPPDRVTFSKDKQTATFETETEATSLLKAIQLYPFFRFCVHREEPLTKIYLCSKDLYLKKLNSKIIISSRDSYRPQSFVEINGQSVGPQGMIFLNAPSEILSFRGLLLSGATLELETRMKKVNFKDVYLSTDEKMIIVKAQGSEPVDPSLVERKPGDEPDEWQTQLEVERPYTYLKGEGDLPLRQEFLIQGSVRKEDIQVSIVQGADDLVFKDEHEMILKPLPGLTLSNADKRTKLDRFDNEYYRWTLLGLKKNESNRRYVRVRSAHDDFMAAYDLERLAAYDATIRVMAPVWLQGQLLYTPGQRWGFAGQYDQQIGKAAEDPQLKIWTLAGHYRFPEGVHLRDSMLAAELYTQSLQTDAQSLMLLGVGLEAEWKSPRYWKRSFPWTFLRLRLPVTTTNPSYQIKESLEAELSFRILATPTFYSEFGVRHHKYLISGDGGDTSMEKSLLFLGLGTVF